jgi:anaerobic selenocysteine-containing dehydrogenase
VPRDELSYCRICAAACGIVVTVDGDRVVRVRGDDDHPVSRGYVCSKGRGLAAWHHSSLRLDRPRLRGRTVSWDELLADLASRVNTVIDGIGPDAVALYLATGLAYDAAGQIAASQWLPSIGSRSFLTAVTVDNAPVLVAAQLVSGQPMLNPVWDPTVAGVAIFVGTNPVVSHGYGTALPDPIRHLRDYRARGGRVWVLDPRRTETAANADAHVSVRPGADVAVLAALAKALLDDGADERELRDHCDPTELTALRAALAGFTVERAAAVADVDRALLDALVADVRTHRGRVAMHCGTGVTMARDGVVAEWLRWVVLIASGSLDRAGGMQFHRGVVQRLRRRGAGTGPGAPDLSASKTRPELPRVVGQVPAVALVDEIEAGNIRALFVTGGNPLTAFPQPARLEAALRTLDVLAVVDVAENALTDIATHVLPATGQLERADITLHELTALRSGMQATRAVVEPAADRRPVWWMFAALTRAMEGEPANASDPGPSCDEDYLRSVLAHARLDADTVFTAGPRGVETPAEPGWVHDELLPDGHWSIAPSTLLQRLAAHTDPAPTAYALAPRREMPWSNSVAYGAIAPGPVVRMNATADGRVTVSTEHGEVTTAFVTDPAIRPGVISMTHGHLAANPGNLTSGADGIDRLTAMPRVAGLEVRVTPVDGNADGPGAEPNT